MAFQGFNTGLRKIDAGNGTMITTSIRNPKSKIQNRIRVIIVIPVYNHGATLRVVVEKVCRLHDAVMVVDDGSTDGGYKSILDLDVHRVRHSYNRGKGMAILSAVKEAEKLGMTHMVTLDADGQHDPNDLHLFISAMYRSPRDIVVGKRNFTTGYVPSGSRIGRRISNFWLWVQTGRMLGDTQSGFRGYPISVLKALKLRERRYAFENEVLAKGAWAGVELREVDISTYYPADEDRISHFHLFHDNVRLSLLNARLTLRAMIPRPHRKLP
jgi:glycosyltransferase involved in cell wall biosynthesis